MTPPTPLPDSLANRRRAALLHRIHRRYATLTETVTLAGPAGSVAVEFTRVEDPNRVLDQVAAEEDRRERVSGNRKPGDQLHLPYWAELWDSALGMSQLLLKRFAMADGRRTASSAVTVPSLQPPCRRLSVLDLGCGMGFTGMIAASLGHRVLFADLEPPALLFARCNALPWHRRVRTRRLNWQTARLGETFGLIIGADILYERSQWEYLEPFWRAHLAVDGRLLLGEPGRQTGDDFPTWAAARGWQIIYHQEPVATRSRPIRLFELRRP